MYLFCICVFRKSKRMDNCADRLMWYELQKKAGTNCRKRTFSNHPVLTDTYYCGDSVRLSMVTSRYVFRYKEHNILPFIGWDADTSFQMGLWLDWL